MLRGPETQVADFMAVQLMCNTKKKEVDKLSKLWHHL